MTTRKSRIGYLRLYVIWPFCTDPIQAATTVRLRDSPKRRPSGSCFSICPVKDRFEQVLIAFRDVRTSVIGKNSRSHSHLSTNFKDLRNLPKDDPGLRAKADGRWYLPDPNEAGDLLRWPERLPGRSFRRSLS